MCIKIQSIGYTKEIDGDTSLIMASDMPAECVVLFLDKQDYKELLELLKERTIGDSTV